MAPSRSQSGVLHLDGSALRVLAHPLRSRLLSALRLDGPGTATVLAAALHTNTGATSYHLRKLADVGLVEETGTGRGKERVWRAATEAHSWGPRTLMDDPDGQAASQWLERHYFQQFAEKYASWLDGQQDWPVDWREALAATDRVLTLTVKQLGRLSADIDDVLARYRRLPDEAATAEQTQTQPLTPTAQIQIFVHSFPRSALPPC